MIDALAAINATLAVLLEDERGPREGIGAASRWARVHQGFGHHLTSGQSSPSAMRRLTLDAFIANLGHGLTEAANEAGLGHSELQAWRTSRADDEIARLPYLGRQRELIHLRLLNPQDVWEVNDLIDVLYLTCATAYADYVVCEKKMADYLRRTERRLPGGAQVLTSVTDLMDAVSHRPTK